MKTKWIGVVAACTVLAAWAASVGAVPPPPTLWGTQIGTSQIEWSAAIAVDGLGNSYITGPTEGDLGGPNQGSADVFVVKCDSGGTVQWTRQIGTTEYDGAEGIAVDASGNIYVTGSTLGDLGGPNQGSGDAFIAKFDSGGTVQWTRQIGTTEYDGAEGIAVDGGGNVYITGDTLGDLGGPVQGWRDAFIVKYDSGGTEQWTRQIGTSAEDGGWGIAVDGAGNSYITGETSGDLGGPNQGSYDAFIVKCDSDGTEQWARQIGSAAWDTPFGIAVDGSGNSYITGYTEGDLGGPNQGWMDVFVAKHDSTGALQWTRQTGTSDADLGYGIAVDPSGNSYIAGQTDGDLGGPNQGDTDVFIVKYDGGGTAQWVRQIGSSDDDRAYGISLDGSGNGYVTGETDGDLAGPSQGSPDAFIVAIGSQPATGGDATLDGCVDGLDYVVWSSNYHQSDKWWEEGDFTGEGDVDGLDYIIWSNNYGQGCPGTPGPVPEPATLSLLALGGLALVHRRRRPEPPYTNSKEMAGRGSGRRFCGPKSPV